MNVGLPCKCARVHFHVVLPGEVHGSHSFDGRQTPGAARHSTSAARCAAEPMQAPVQICSRGSAQSLSLQAQLKVAMHNDATAVAILLTLLSLNCLWFRLRKHQHTHSAAQEPLLFSKCCYNNLTFRTSDKSRLQTLQAAESMVDKYRMGCSIYAQLAEKLNLESCQPFQDLRRSLYLTSAPHVKLMQRIKEPSLSERISSLGDDKLNHSVI